MAIKRYAQKPDELLKELEVNPKTGLSADQVTRRLAQFGRNELSVKKHFGALNLFFGQFKDILILILLAAATVSLGLSFVEKESTPTEAFLIYAIVLAIAVVGFLNEYKAEQTVAALRKLLSFSAKVLRNGQVVEVPVSELVPGDILLLEEGQKIPADARLIEANALQVNEASLTGESVPDEKETKVLPDKTIALGDQTNMIFSGTLVTTGTGKAVVVATGAQTEIGRIATLVSDVGEVTTPMQQKLDSLGKRLGAVVVVICAVAFLAIFFLDHHDATADTATRLAFAFTAAVALAVAAIPEGLAFVVRISLALGARRMADRKALVRRLSAVESLGSTDIVCTDKTGTLTRGEMTVRRLYQNGAFYDLTGEGYLTKGELQKAGKQVEVDDDLRQLLKIGVLSNNAKLREDKPLGDPTEASLLVSAAKFDLVHDKLLTDSPRVHEVPFSSARKMMSTVHAEGSDYLVATKGAPEVVLGTCSTVLVNGREETMTAQRKQEIESAINEMTSQALRVLGFAYRKHTAKPSNDMIEKDLVFAGLQGIMDPPRAEVKEVIGRVQQEAGMRVIMITGDNIETAKAIAKELNITGEALSGSELAEMGEDEFKKRVEKIGVYARVNPEHKIRIVQALQGLGHQVAMTGDGVNDAPAIKAANIGIAMGVTGTDAAKEASDLILLDDQFLTIINAIEEGRGIYDNVRKFVNFLLSTNIAEVTVVLLGLLLHGNLLLSAVQILFINIITDGLPALALGSDAISKDAMRRKPSYFQQAIVNRRTWAEIIVFGLLMSAVVLTHYNAVLASGGTVLASSVVFVSIIIYTFTRLVDIRTDYRISWLSNPWLSVSILGSVAILLSVLYIQPLAQLFSVAPIPLADWGVIAAASLGLIIVMKILNPILNRAVSQTE